MNTWLILLAMGIVTYATRALPLLISWEQPPRLVERALRHMPPAIFAALIAPPILMPTGTGLEIGSTLGAALIGASIAWRTRSIALTIIAGLGAFACLNWLSPA
jgi:branched-subunit amino acid transport protein